MLSDPGLVTPSPLYDQASQAELMIDLETAGYRAGCSLISLGAVAFQLEGTGPLCDTSGAPITFYRVIDLKSCERAGLKIDPDTFVWWVKRGAAYPIPAGDPLGDVLMDFLEFYRWVNCSWLWGHGASFDPPILEAAMEAAGLGPVPWGKSSQDTRTLFRLAGWKMRQRTGGGLHNALEDALYQVAEVQAAYAHLRAQ